MMEFIKWIRTVATNSNYFSHVAFTLLFAEVFFLIFIIKFVPYTEIDWVAYMQEVEGVLNGTLDYSYLGGDTGPLVYPAGFVYIFLGFYFLTERGSNVMLAQLIFAVLYLLNLSVVLAIYRSLFRNSKHPPYLLLFLGCTAYRVHSIYVLRLFNDPIAMLLLYCAVLLFLDHNWTWGCTVYSLAVSIKMNILLFSPGLLVLLIRFLGWRSTIIQLALCALIQVIIGLPFLLHNPVTYFNGAFNFSRQFLYKWTVNWRLLPEWIFLHRGFHVGLLLCQLLVLLMFCVKHWTGCAGLKSLLKWRVTKKPRIPRSEIGLILFTSNFIGISFSRSLHYQFYVWYFHTLPFLLWSTDLYPAVRMGILLILEWAWNVYPSTVFSSAALHLAHLIILAALYNTRVTLAPRKD